MAMRVCPWWMGYLLANPVRRLWHKPEVILAPWIKAEMVVLDMGCGMGFFSVPMARMVGPGGRVISVDLQPKMLAGLMRRAERAKVAKRITPTPAPPTPWPWAIWRGRSTSSWCSPLPTKSRIKAGCSRSWLPCSSRGALCWSPNPRRT
jgi:SAM-dependent methyltransferase